jgi:hypothetical protein
MAKNEGAKGNPAHKRIGNAQRKAYRQTVWARQEKRKDIRRKAQAAAHARNVANGISPWDISKQRRAEKRG